jgi:hypothetical protein
MKEEGKGNNTLKVSDGKEVSQVWLVHTFNPSTQEAEVGGLQVQGEPGLYSESLP